MDSWTWGSRLWAIVGLLGLAGDRYYFHVLNVHHHVPPPPWLTLTTLLTLAILITLPALQLIEIVLLCLRRRRWQSFFLSSVLFVGVFVLIAATLVSGMAHAK